MILICPHCAARSRVDDGEAQKPMAQVQCGGCSKRYYVSAAYRDTDTASAAGGRVGTAAAVLRARRGTRRMGQRPWGKWAQPALALALPLVLLALCLWDVRRMGPVGEALQAEVQVAAAQAQGLAFAAVRVDPYAPTGGAEGLLVTGEVINGSAQSQAFVPVVAVRAGHPGLPAPVAVRLRAGPGMTLAQAPSLTPLGAEEIPAALQLPAGQKVPFVGLVPLPELAGAQLDGPWQVQVAW